MYDILEKVESLGQQTDLWLPEARVEEGQTAKGFERRFSGGGAFSILIYNGGYVGFKTQRAVHPQQL